MILLASRVPADDLPGVLAELGDFGGLVIGERDIRPGEEKRWFWNGRQFRREGDTALKFYTKRKTAQDFLDRLADEPEADKKRGLPEGAVPLLWVYVDDKEAQFEELRERLRALGGV